MIQLVVMTPNDLAVTIAVGVPCDQQGNAIRNVDGTAVGYSANGGGVISMDDVVNGYSVGSVMVSATGYASQTVIPSTGLTPVILNPAGRIIPIYPNTTVLHNPAVQTMSGANAASGLTDMATAVATQVNKTVTAATEEKKKTFFEAHEHYIKLGFVLLVVGLGVAFIKDKLFKS